MFYSLEQPHEQTTKSRSVREISDQRRDFLEKMWNLSRLDNEGLWKSVAEDDIENITRRLFEAFDSNYVTAAVLNSNATVNHWTFTAAIFFTSTLLTTIGELDLNTSLDLISNTNEKESINVFWQRTDSVSAMFHVGCVECVIIPIISLGN